MNKKNNKKESDTIDILLNFLKEILIEEKILNKNKFIDQITESIKKLNKGLTEDRKLIGTNYLNDKENLIGYFIYYFLISYLEINFLLKKINFKKKLACDIGCGPGPISYALLENKVDKIVSIDKSSYALKLLKKIFNKKKFNNFELIEKNLELEQQLFTDSYNKKFDIIILSKVLNELWNNKNNKIDLRYNFVNKLFNYLDDQGYLIIIEPALFNITRDNIELRNKLINNNYNVIYPCLCKKECDVIKNKNSTCHIEFGWKKTKFIKKLIDLAKLKKESIKFSTFIFSKQLINNNIENYMIISDIMLSKSGKYRYIICGKNGRFSLSLKKNLITDFYYDFIKLKRGDIIYFENFIQKQNGFELDNNSVLKIIKKII